MAERALAASWTSERLSALQEFAVRSRTMAHRASLDGGALRTLDALARVGVDALLLKGAALAQLLYRDDEARGYCDVDLLIAPDDLPVAGRALTGLGYWNLSELRGLDDVAGILHAHEWSTSVEGIGSVAIDLHWRLDGCEAASEIVWDVLSARRTTVEISGHRVATLDQAGLALHLALHAAQHGPTDLKAVGDLKRGLERWPPETWRQAAQLADVLRGTEAFAAGLALVPAGAGLARELRLPPADVLLWEMAHRDSRPRGTFHLDAFMRAGSLRERIGILRRSLLPPPAWIVWEYRWAGKRRLLIAGAYLLHVARAPVWATRAWHWRQATRRINRDDPR